MDIAYTIAPGRGETDLLLAAAAVRLAAAGLALAGTVQVNTDREDCRGCDMDVKVLPDGPVVRISQSLGPESRGCRLDPAALESAVGTVMAHLDAGRVDLLIINKFGKHEADGRGFREAIGTAVAQDIPVLVGTNTLNRDAFVDFTGGVAVALDPQPDAVMGWATAVTDRSGRAAG